MFPVLDLFLQNIVPFTILMVVGMIWLLIYGPFIIAPKMFPEHWCLKEA